MRIAFISDVHANLVALEAVMARVDDLEVDRVFCAGDVVGYYPYPNETISLFQSRGIESIAGNHDRSVISEDTSWMNLLAAEAILWTHDHLSASSKEFLSFLPKSMHIEAATKIGIFHGSPLDEDEYVLEEQALPFMLAASNCRVVVLGHTHVPFIKRFEEGAILNPGSVGQPRDGDPRASFATLEADSEEVSFHRVEYDIDEVARKTAESGLPEALGERLRYGL